MKENAQIPNHMEANKSPFQIALARLPMLSQSASKRTTLLLSSCHESTTSRKLKKKNSSNLCQKLSLYHRKLRLALAQAVDGLLDLLLATRIQCTGCFILAICGRGISSCSCWQCCALRYSPDKQAFRGLGSVKSLLQCLASNPNHSTSKRV